MTTPDCPKCGSSMVLRTAKKGRNRGGQFYGCSKYPACRGIVPYEPPETEVASEGTPTPRYNAPAAPTQSPQPVIRRRVPWTDATTSQRDGWDSWVLPVGGGFRSFTLHPVARSLSRDTWIAVSATDSYEPADDDTVRVCSMVRKLLQRGANAPIESSLERALLKHLDVVLEEPVSEFDIAPVVSPATARQLSGQLPARPLPDEAVIDHLAWDSEEERIFHVELLPKLLDYGAPRWFVPQAPLDSLLAGRGLDVPTSGERRVDFLVAAPGREPFVVEIDGQQHDAAQGVDDARDSQLRAVGIDVLRIPAAEVRAAQGPGLDRLIDVWQQPELADDDANHLLLAPAQVNRLLLSLVTAVEQGFLLGDRWVIEVDDELDVVRSVLPSALGLIAAIDDLWGQIIAPSTVWLRAGGSVLRYERREYGYRSVSAQDCPDLDVAIVLDTTVGPVESMPEHREVPVVVTRPAVLPVEIRMDAYSTIERVGIKADTDAAERALETLLRWLFARPSFREGQLQGVRELLAGRDAVVLLPTGAGKSLIYQLAGLLLPGVTLVVDPIVALMEDQVRGLGEHGIDRVIGISSHLVQQGFREELLTRVGSGDTQFVFIAPERLQQTSFRDALQQLSATTMINLAVADEAHCVSEWGHDFRTAYLRLGPTLRRLCADAAGVPPPLVALTGTASRSVLRDVLLELDIDPGGSPDTMIRPRTFDRPELDFTISAGPPDSAEARLKATVQGLPSRFRQRQGFFSPNGRRSNAGVLFTPHVNGAFGVADTATLLTPVIGYEPTVYSGSAPKNLGLSNRDWGDQKRRNATNFQRDEIPTLIATKSFGMGIDKPNIRWVVHYGIPGSLEAYYQEAGRGGRDRQRAHCALVFSEFSEDQARELLDGELTVEQVRARHDAVGRRETDDVTRMLFFYLNIFRGVDDELQTLAEVVDELGEVERVRVFEIPMWRKGSSAEHRERALHRLVLLGIVEDYTVDYGAKTFGVRIAPASPASVVGSLLAFVSRTQPARGAALASRLDATVFTTLHEAIEACARELMTFVYDTIAASRLRSLREMWLAARQGDGEELRQRIIDYFNEGSAAPMFEALVDRVPFRYEDWLDALDQLQLPDDALEWRGASARLLISEPEHPGLLLVRAIAEELAPGGSSAEFGANLTASFEHATSRYGASDDDIRRTCDTLIDLLKFDLRVPAAKRSDVSLIIGALRSAGHREVARELLAARVLSTGADPELATMFLVDELAAVRSDLHATLGVLSSSPN